MKYYVGLSIVIIGMILYATHNLVFGSALIGIGFIIILDSYVRKM